MTFFVGVLTGFYCLSAVIWRDRTERANLLRRLALIFVVAALLAAAQLLPTLEFLPREIGGRIRNSDQSVASVRHTLIGIPALITFVFPALAGSPETFDLLKFLKSDLISFTGYIGIIPCTLFAIGAATNRDGRVKALLMLIVASLVVIFLTPLVRFVYTWAGYHGKFLPRSLE